MKYYISLFILFGILMVRSAKAQDDCFLKLTEAEKLFENGQIEQIPNLITNCIESGYNRENKIRALKLLTLAYLFDDNTIKAEKTLLKLLKIDPEYKVNQAVDPVEFIKLYNSFNTTPVFSIGPIFSPSLTMPYLLEPISLNDFSESNPKYSSGGMSITAGIKASYHLNHIWDINLEPSFSFLKSKVIENNYSKSIVTITETMNYITFPISGSYYFYKINNFQFFGEAGASFDLFLSGNINGIISYNNNELAPEEPSEIQTKELRKPYNLMSIIGAGTKIDLGRSNIQVCFRYKVGLMNQGNSDQANLINESLNWDYIYQDNLFSINNLSFAISFNREFYVHRKKPNNQTNYDVIR
ncbi:MAG: outer membrane beta-barrel protein [Salinivirgaceae bacterium]|jgi:hypothetical protein|nr:outer membrane beta-barrel protein [Salinivirgaceae bacterium]